MLERFPSPGWLALLCVLVLLGCPSDDDDDVADDDVTDDDDDDDDTTAVDPVSVPHDEGCENVNPLHCAMPFPSDRFLAADAETTTGYRLAYTQELLPEGLEGFDLSPWERLDGHSPATAIMTLLPSPADLDASGAAAWDDIGRSLDDDSPTVILDMHTGERVAHFAENDLRAQSEDETVLYLRQVSRFVEDRSYVVAIRGLVDADGAPFEASEAFAALRDGVPTDSDEIEDRRARFEDAFTALAEAGVDRAGLQQAWTFHTASGDSIRRDMMHIRADALDRLGPDGIGCSVTSVEEGYGGDGRTLRRIRGTYTVPSYVDSPDPPTQFARGADDLPEYVDDYEVPFTIIVPQSLVDEAPVAGPLVTFGHGLLGTGEGTISMGSVREIAHETGTILVATDWAGMCSADVPTVGMALGDPANFVSVTERLQQGMVNQIALTRTFAGVCADIPELAYEGVPLVATDRLNYVGVSQGGIYGGTLMTLSPDIDRGTLLVNGVVFPFMMERSIDYAPYLPLFELAWPDRMDQVLLLPVAQHLWDASEPAGYLPHLTAGLDGIGPKEVLSIAVVNDAQVPNLSTDMAMRMVDVPVVEGSAMEPWGFDVLPAPVQGSALVYIDMGDRDIPEGNVAPEYDDGGHSAVGTTEPALTMIMEFFETGQVPMPCDGICDPD